MKLYWKTILSLSLTLLVIIAFSQKATAVTGENKVIELLSNNKHLTLLEEGKAKKYFLLTKKSPVIIRASGPSILNVDFRKNIYPQHPGSLEPLKLVVIIDKKKKKQYKITPRKSLAGFRETKAFQPSRQNLFKITIPKGEHIYEFHLPEVTKGGGAMAFGHKKMPLEKATKVTEVKKVTKKKRVAEKKRITEKITEKELKAAKVPSKIEKDRPGLCLGAQIGGIFSQGYLNSFYPQLDVGYYLPLLDNNLRLSLAVGYYASSESKDFKDAQDYNLNYTLTVIPITLDIYGEIPLLNLPLQIIPFLGVGAGVYITKFDYTYGTPIPWDKSENELDWGLHVSTGILKKVESWEVSLNLKYSNATFDNDNGIKGQLGGISICAGVGYIFSF